MHGLYIETVTLTYRPIIWNSSWNESLNQPYRIGLEKADDIPIRWQKAKQIRLVSFSYAQIE